MDIRIIGILAVEKQPCKFAVYAMEGETKEEFMQKIYTSSSLVVSTLMASYKLFAPIDYDLYEGTMQIRRINPITCPKKVNFAFPKGSYYIDRIATQTTPDGPDHLEVFIKKSEKEVPVSYNVYDPILQQVLLSTFDVGSNHENFFMEINRNEDDKTIISLCIGVYPKDNEVNK